MSVPCVAAKALGEQADTIDLGYALVQGVMVPHASKFKSVIDHIQKNNPRIPRRQGWATISSNYNSYQCRFLKSKITSLHGNPSMAQGGRKRSTKETSLLYWTRVPSHHLEEAGACYCDFTSTGQIYTLTKSKC